MHVHACIHARTHIHTHTHTHTQVQAEQMSNEELRIRLETLQDGFVQLRSIMRKDKQSRVETERGDD